jgi:hypothetical protein
MLMNNILPSKKFLEGLDDSMTQWTQHRFLEVIRHEPRPTEPTEVVEGVKLNLLTPNDKAKAQELGTRLEQSPEDALALAAYNLQQQAKTAEQKKEEKAAKKALYQREHLLKLPPTEPQLAELSRLGCKRAVASRQEAMDLLDQMKRPRRVA